MNEQSDSTDHLKNVVEQSLDVLCEGKDFIRANSQTGLFHRSSLPLHLDGANLKKRALSDAAKALAALWKISKPRRAKLPVRAMKYSSSTS